MNYRELLQYAAKAAGNPQGRHVTQHTRWDGLLMANDLYWSPISDDGDTFRLAVKCLPFYTLQYSREDYEACNQDGLAATRLAIVRAVAEIGRSMT